MYSLNRHGTALLVAGKGSGCVEAWAFEQAILRDTALQFDEGTTDFLSASRRGQDPRRLTISQVAAAAEHGPTRSSRQVLSQAGHYLGVGLAALR